MNKKSEVKARIAPSPTGWLHIGTARTALFNYLFTRKNKGKFYLRIEDTDRTRSTKEYEDDIITGLKWLNLDWDDEIIKQSERIKEGDYNKKLKELKEEGLVYPCFCSKKELKKDRKRQLERGIAPKYSGKCRSLKEKEVKKLKKKGKKPAFRLNVKKLAEKKEVDSPLVFEDIIRGKIKREIDEIGDFILVKKDKTPLYQFVVVIDDHDMKITHVIRGEDHITNTFNQLLLYYAFGFKPPKFAHLPLILDKDKSKLSKRKNNVVAIKEFKKEGYLPEALVNYMALLGWSPDKEKEVFSLKEAVENFRLKDVNQSPAVFERNKLNYLNGHYIREKSNKEILKLLKETRDLKVRKEREEYYLKVVSLVKDRIKKLSEFEKLSQYFFQAPEYKTDLLVFEKSDKEKTLQGLRAAYQSLRKTDEKVWDSKESLNQVLADQITGSNLENGDLFWPVRAALSGKEGSPSPSELLWALGKKESLKRIDKAIGKLEE